MKRKISLLLVIVLSIMTIFSACKPVETGKDATGEKTESTEPKEENKEAEAVPEKSVEQKLTFALQNEPDGMDPGITNNTYAIPFLCNAFEGLVTYDNDNNLVPGNAESWDVSKDGLTYTFKLRDGLKWSDGSDLTSEDFIYSWKRVLDPKTGSRFVDMLTAYIKNAQEYYEGKCEEKDLGIKAIDKKTLEITLKAPTPFFLDILSIWVYDPVKKDVVEAAPERWAQDAKTYISNGPFKITEINFGESVVLVKNENYWNAKNVKLEQITFRYILEQATALSAFESGEIDGSKEVPPADLPRLKAESDSLQIVPSFGTTFYLINNKAKPLDNVKVRKALNLALDRTALIENVLQSTDETASSIVSPGYMVNGKDYTDGRPNHDITPTANVKEAQKLLAEAGYPDGKGFPVLKFSYSTNPIFKKTVEAMQQMWKQNLNIDMEISTEEWKVYYDNVQAGKYEIAQMGWGGDYLHPMTFLPLFVTDGPNNNSFYSNPKYDELVTKAQSEIDEVKAAAIMREAEEVLMADYPFLPLFHRSYTFLMKPYVKGWGLTPLNNLYFKNAYIEK